MPSRYQKVQKLLPEIKQMFESGMSRREVGGTAGTGGQQTNP